MLSFLNTKYQIPNTKARQAGFSLIESILVVGIFAIIALLSTQFLFSALKGGTKSEVESEARQNGSYALSTLSQMIRNSQETKSPPSPPYTAPDECTGGTIQTKNPDGGYSIFCCAGSGTDTYIASHSATGSIGTHRLTTSKVRIPYCSIRYTSPPSGSPSVDIDFTVATNTTSTRPEEREPGIRFQTRVTLRNY